jgi:hypothetical protein
MTVRSEFSAIRLPACILERPAPYEGHYRGWVIPPTGTPDNIEELAIDLSAADGGLRAAGDLELALSFYRDDFPHDRPRGSGEAERFRARCGWPRRMVPRWRAAVRSPVVSQLGQRVVVGTDVGSFRKRTSALNAQAEGARLWWPSTSAISRRA